MYSQFLQRCNHPLSQCCTNLQLSPQHSCGDWPGGVTHLIHTCNGSLTSLPSSFSWNLATSNLRKWSISGRNEQASNLILKCIGTIRTPKLVKTNSSLFVKYKPARCNTNNQTSHPLFQCSQAAFFGNTTGGLLGFTNSAVVSADWATMAEVQRWLGGFLFIHLQVGSLSWSHCGIYFLKLAKVGDRIILLLGTFWHVSGSEMFHVAGLIWCIERFLKCRILISKEEARPSHVTFVLRCLKELNGKIHVFLTLGFVHHRVAWTQLKHVYFQLINLQHSSDPQAAKQAYRAWRPKTTKSSKELAPKRFAPCTEAQPAWTIIQAEV